MFPHHAKHFHIDDQEADKLPQHTTPEPLGQFGRHRGIITLFVRFPEFHGFRIYSGTIFQKGFPLALYKKA